MRWDSVTTGAILVFVTAGVLLSLVGLGAAVTLEMTILVSVVLMTTVLVVALVGGTVGRERTTTPYW